MVKQEIYYSENDKNKFVGLQGTFQSLNKSICSLCHGHEEVGMF